MVNIFLIQTFKLICLIIRYKLIAYGPTIVNNNVRILTLLSTKPYLLKRIRLYFYNLNIYLYYYIVLQYLFQSIIVGTYTNSLLFTRILSMYYSI